MQAWELRAYKNRFYQPGWDVGYAHKDPVVMDSNTGEKIEDPAKWLK